MPADPVAAFSPDWKARPSLRMWFKQPLRCWLLVKYGWHAFVACGDPSPTTNERCGLPVGHEGKHLSVESGEWRNRG